MDISQQRLLENIEPSKLKISGSNARTHSKTQIGKIAKSMQHYGCTNPILIDVNNRIIAGHGRVAAAIKLGLATVPCLRISHLSDSDIRAYMIADNELALLAGWDFEILATEFQGLIEQGYEIELTGFEQPEVDAIIAEQQEASVEPDEPEDDIPQPCSSAITRLGDCWRIGRHGLVCGDAKDPSVLNALMGDDLAHMMLTDPPFNVKIGGNVCGLGRIRHREFVEASGEMSEEEFIEFLYESLVLAAKYCRNGAIVFVFIDWRHLKEALAAGHRVFSMLKNICVWVKANGGMGAFYRSRHEMVLAWKVGDAPHTNNFGLGGKGRYRTNVWTYAGINSFRPGRMDELALHPTVKPVALVADAIRDVSNRGEIVLDVFGGSGTTLIAAEKTGRSARLVELDPIYCDVIVRRWQKLTGKEAILLSTGETFEDVTIARNAHTTLSGSAVQ